MKIYVLLQEVYNKFEDWEPQKYQEYYETLQQILDLDLLAEAKETYEIESIRQLTEASVLLSFVTKHGTHITYSYYEDILHTKDE